MMMMLKEWSTVERALEAGQQTVLLRKGGILETASGFKVESKRFLIYPTWEHQTRENIRKPFWYHLDNVEKPVSGHNRISLLVEVLAQADVSSEETVHNLEPFHIWSRPYIASRRRWQPKRPLKAIFLRTYRIKPFTIPIQDSYAGCRSWLELDAGAMSDDPVLEQKTSDKMLKEFQRIVS